MYSWSPGHVAHIEVGPCRTAYKVTGEEIDEYLVTSAYRKLSSSLLCLWEDTVNELQSTRSLSTCGLEFLYVTRACVTMETPGVTEHVNVTS